MHEAALARELLQVVLERAGARRIRAVRGWIAETESLSRESLALHFQAAAAATLAEGAQLDLELLHVRARCLSCGAEYLPDHHLTLCPECGSVEGELLGQTGIYVESIEV